MDARASLTEIGRRARGRIARSSGVVLPDIDGRCWSARRYATLVDQIVLDQGGDERISEARRALCRRFAAVCVMTELLEARLMRNEGIDTVEYAQLVSALCRISSRIGIGKAGKPVPSLDAYLAQRKAEQQAELSEADDEQ